jgi:ABC-type multidrug transport system fused ATPase/permease subunit
MEIYDLFRGAFAWMATIACLWPLNIAWMGFAQRIREGPLEEDDERKMGSDELWPRAAYASFAVAVVTIAFLFVDWFLADWSGVPSGIVHLMTFIVYVAVGVWAVAFFWAFEDLVDGLSLFTMYFALPIFVLFVLNYFLGFWNPLLRLAYAWLKQSA